MPNDLEVDILKILLKPPHREDISIRQIAKKLRRPSSHIFYYLKKMTRDGILTKEESGERGYYKLQPIFGCEVETTIKMLSTIANNINEATDEKLANCITIFIKLYGS